MRKPVGRVVLHISSTVAPGVGLALTAAGGTLNLLDGTAHAFVVSGLNLHGQVGSPVDLEAKGKVCQLQRLEDFAGTYRRAMGEVDPQRSTNEAERQKLRHAYLPKFRKALREKQVARYYQLENKIQAAVSYELAAEIPLVK
jgi:hypothetical protein